jgi:hypothetical protein
MTTEFLDLLQYFILVVSNPRKAKILLLELPNISIKELNDLIVHCSTNDDLLVQSMKYVEYTLIIACISDKLNEVSSILPDISFDTLYVLHIGEKINGSVEPWWNKTTVVYTEKQLMRHLCTKSMLCYFNEGLEHRKDGNVGLSNACMLDSLRALDCSVQFI